jgi:hypothetical protein
MQELSTNINSEVVRSEEIFNINYTTDAVISCIQGKDASPKITRTLISQGYSNYRCLSGGLIALSDYFRDEDSSRILTLPAQRFGVSLQQRIIQETGKSQTEYYHSLEGKKLYIITHKIIKNLQGTILQDELENIGVKEIICFQTVNDFYKSFKDKKPNTSNPF